MVGSLVERSFGYSDIDDYAWGHAVRRAPNGDMWSGWSKRSGRLVEQSDEITMALLDRDLDRQFTDWLAAGNGAAGTPATRTRPSLTVPARHFNHG